MQPIKTYCAQNSVRLLMAAVIIAGLCFGVLDPSVAVAGGFVFLGDTAPTSLKELHEAMQKAFDTMRGEIKKVQDTADGALTEVKKEGTLHGETNTKLTEVMTAAKAAQDQVKEFATRILDVEQKLVRRPGGGNGDEAKSIGTRFIESKEFKDAIAAGNNSTPWVKNRQHPQGDHQRRLRHEPAGARRPATRARHHHAGAAPAHDPGSAAAAPDRFEPDLLREGKRLHEQRGDRLLLAERS
jgi:hypothetical protein